MASTYIRLPVVEGGVPGAVDSFNGRDGIVLPTSGDYPANFIVNTPAGNIAATDVQAALNELDSEKQATITGAASTVVSSNLTASRAVESNGSGKLAASSVTSTELGYLSGVTSAVQTQLNSKQVSGNYITALTGDVSASGPGSVAATISGLDATKLATALVTNNLLNFNAASLRHVINFKEDFDAASGLGKFAASTAGSGSAAALYSGALLTANHPGIVELQTGTTSNGRASLGAGEIRLPGGATNFDALININALSLLSDEYELEVGFGDAGPGSGNDNTEGIYFKYDRTTSVNWLRCTANNSTATETASGTAVATGWTNLSFVLNADGTSVEFFVNGVSIGTNNTNMVSGTALIKPYLRLRKTNGNTSVLVYVDYVQYGTILGTPRY